MRNDARPIGHDAAHSALRNPQSDEARAPMMPDRQGHLVDRRAEEHAQRGDDAVDPAMPADDATLNTRI